MSGGAASYRSARQPAVVATLLALASQYYIIVVVEAANQPTITLFVIIMKSFVL
jgi:hypothetical protein